MEEEQPELIVITSEGEVSPVNTPSEDTWNNIPSISVGPSGELYPVDPLTDSAFSKFIQLQNITKNEQKNLNTWRKSRNWPGHERTSYFKDYNIEGAHVKTLDAGEVVAGNIIGLVACYFTPFL